MEEWVSNAKPELVGTLFKATLQLLVLTLSFAYLSITHSYTLFLSITAPFILNAVAGEEASADS